MIRNRSELDACLFKEWQAQKDKSFIYGYTRDRMDESARALAEKIGEGGKEISFKFYSLFDMWKTNQKVKEYIDKHLDELKKVEGEKK